MEIEGTNNTIGTRAPIMRELPYIHIHIIAVAIHISGIAHSQLTISILTKT